jgi:hypothetical protein
MIRLRPTRTELFFDDGFSAELPPLTPGDERPLTLRVAAMLRG